MIKKILFLTFASIGLVHGAAVSIPDFSFEQLGLAAGGWNNDEGPNWMERDGANDGDSFVEHIAGFAADGTQHLGMNTGYYVAQDLGVAWAPNTTYTLTIGAGNRNDAFTVAGNATTYGLLNFLPSALGGFADTAAVLGDAGTLASAMTDASVLTADGTFADAPSLVFSTGAVAPSGNVVVLLGDNAGGGRSHFDNIRLDASPIPEPTVTLLGALAGLALLRRRR